MNTEAEHPLLIFPTRNTREEHQAKFIFIFNRHYLQKLDHPE